MRIFDLRIPADVLDEVSAEVGRPFDHFKAPEREKGEAMAAFNGWKAEVTAGSARGLSTGVVGVSECERPGLMR
jgi:hypothetical protein